ncbi:methyltransferase [Caballeronia sp. SEWSISQ10-4 2]|uniref:class I SAM-dependent methyltransferase n=1 Tax=Caballeronia sp. SEWSISQ10-4 2 TaxID=2937438 RepID=UPI00264F0F52|nr:methyltransferase [Caballeronia sp. SEWSISQ10-4 2]MDN7181431.1 methyltransferase [Caballeronia sp. SEWSISQ10-4 2]
MKTLLTPQLMRRAFLALPAALLLASCVTPTASTSLDTAIAAPYRGEKAQARDVYRHPKETLEFFGVAPTQSVLEIAPGGGWYTDILAPYLQGRGTLYEAQYLPPQGSLPEGEAKGNAAFERKLAAKPNIYGTVVVGTLQAGQFSGLPSGLQVDRVLTFRNIHNWIEDGQVDANLRAFYSVLKPGGVLGVEEHRAVPGTSVQQMIDTGYLTEAYVIQHAQAAGFKLAARSEINDNPRDTKDYPHGVWSLPPTYRGGDTDHARFAAIGESDRMTLRFVKP